MIWKTFLAVLAASVLAQFFVQTQPHFEIERLFAFNAVYGFLCCAVLILVAKALGLLLKRKDDHYRD